MQIPASWEALVSALEVLAGAETFDEIVTTLCEAAPKVAGADGAKISRRDAGHMLYLAETGPERLWQGRRIPDTDCFSGWCMRQGEAALVPDPATDTRIPAGAYRPATVKSLLALPLGSPVVVGAVAVYWLEPRAIGEAELAPLRTLSRAATAAVMALRRRDLAGQNDAWLSMALTAGGFGVWSLDMVSGEFQISEGAKRIFGRADDDRFTLNSLRLTIHADDRADHQASFESRVLQRGEVSKEYRIVRPDGVVRRLGERGRVVSWVGEQPVRLIFVVADITEQIEARQRMERLQDDIAHLGRLTEMGQMVSALAHELRQPLTAAHNYLGAASRIIAKGEAPVGRPLELIGKADAQFLRANTIIERIRGFAAKADPEKRAQAVRPVVLEAVELAKLDSRHREVRVRIAVMPGLPPILVDKIQIQQVLLNLLRNAFEASEGRSSPNVLVSARPADDEPAVEICVRDTAIGLAPEVLERLFQPFVTTKEGGMGVGLSICRTIVESHGGRMWAQSEPGHGAAFFFTVPAPRAA